MDSIFRQLADCALPVTVGRNMPSTVLQLVPMWGINHRVIPSLKTGCVKNKRQDKLKRKLFPCFFTCPSTNRPRDAHELLLYFGSVVNHCNVK